LCFNCNCTLHIDLHPRLRFIRFLFLSLIHIRSYIFHQSFQSVLLSCIILDDPIQLLTYIYILNIPQPFSIEVIVAVVYYFFSSSTFSLFYLIFSKILYTSSTFSLNSGIRVSVSSTMMISCSSKSWECFYCNVELGCLIYD